MVAKSTVPGKHQPSQVPAAPVIEAGCLIKAYFSEGTREQFTSRMDFAQKALEYLEQLEELLVPEGRDPYGSRARFYVVKAAVSQVANGMIEFIHYGVAEHILQLQTTIYEAYKRTGEQTGYHDVQVAYDILGQMRKFFPVLDAINSVLVCYGNIIRTPEMPVIGGGARDK